MRNALLSLSRWGFVCRIFTSVLCPRQAGCSLTLWGDRPARGGRYHDRGPAVMGGRGRRGRWDVESPVCGLLRRKDVHRECFLCTGRCRLGLGRKPWPLWSTSPARFSCACSCPGLGSDRAAAAAESCSDAAVVRVRGLG